MSRSLLLSITVLLTATAAAATFFLFSDQTDDFGSAFEFTRESEDHTELLSNEAALDEDAAPARESLYLDLPPEACTNECTLYPAASEEERYCRTVCGLSEEAPEGSGTNPSSDEKTAAPYAESVARRDEAIRENNLGKCATITDAAIRKSCEVRVTENLLEEPR